MYSVKFSIGDTKYEISGYSREFVSEKLTLFCAELEKFLEKMKAKKVKIKKGGAD